MLLLVAYALPLSLLLPLELDPDNEIDISWQFTACTPAYQHLYLQRTLHALHIVHLFHVNHSVPVSGPPAAFTTSFLIPSSFAARSFFLCLRRSITRLSRVSSSSLSSSSSPIRLSRISITSIEAVKVTHILVIHSCTAFSENSASRFPHRHSYMAVSPTPS